MFLPQAFACEFTCRSEEHTSELQSPCNLVCRLLLESLVDHRHLHSFPTRRSSDLSRTYLQTRSCPIKNSCSFLRRSRANSRADRKSTRLNSSHLVISYAVFCLKASSTTDIYTLSLHDALPIYPGHTCKRDRARLRTHVPSSGVRVRIHV